MYYEPLEAFYLNVIINVDSVTDDIHIRGHIKIIVTLGTVHK